MNWQSIIEFGFSSTAISAVIIFLGRKFIDYSANKKIEEVKSTLVKDTEFLKYDLSIKANELQIKINKLHEERTVVIKKFYGYLRVFHDKVYLLIISGRGNEEVKVDELYNDYYEMRTYFKQNQILLSKNLSDEIDSLLLSLFSTLFNYNVIVETTKEIEKEANPQMNHTRIKTKRMNWDEASKKLNKEVKPFLDKIESEFRSLLGAD